VVVALSVMDTVQLKSVAVGPHFMLCPTLQISTAASAKYILLLMSLAKLRVLLDHLVSQSSLAFYLAAADYHCRS
jgi:hypothetical protein